MNYANKDEVVDWLRAYAELYKRRAAVSKRRDLIRLYTVASDAIWIADMIDAEDDGIESLFEKMRGASRNGACDEKQAQILKPLRKKGVK